MCKGGAWKGESVWHCSDGETKRAAIEGAKAGRKKETESRSPVIAGGLLKALLGVIQRSLASLSRAATAVYLPLTGWRGFAIKKNICFENSFFHEIILIYNLDYDILI